MHDNTQHYIQEPNPIVFDGSQESFEVTSSHTVETCKTLYLKTKGLITLILDRYMPMLTLNKKNLLTMLKVKGHLGSVGQTGNSCRHNMSY